MSLIVALIIYTIAMTLANLLVAEYGPVVTPVVAFVLVGLDLVLRDWLQVRLKVWQMGGLIACTGVLTYALNPSADQIAMASSAAFTGAALFDWAALLPILGGFAYALSMIMARTMGTKDSAAVMAFWGNNAFLICGLALSVAFGRGNQAEAMHPSLAFLTRGWAMPTLLDAGLMCTCGLIAAVGLTLLTQAYRIGQSSVVAPFEFSFAFWGILWGWLIWQQWPDAMGWLGIAVIVAAGIYVLRAEGVETPKATEA